MPDSQAQVRWAHAVAEGKASGDQAFAREVIEQMHGRRMSSLPEHAGKKKKAHLFGARRRKQTDG